MENKVIHKTLQRKFKEGTIYHCSYAEPYDSCYHDLYNDLFYKNYVFRNNLSSGFYVEIGALDGVVNSQSFIFEKEFKWNGIVVEPNPVWHENLEIYRKCNISKSAISNKKGKALFECREIAAFSGLVSNTSEIRASDITNEIEVETITLIDLLDRYNSPNVIDWVSIDTEGAEFDILTDYLENNKKYRINLINVETADESKLVSLLESHPYVKIKNPYLNFLKLSLKDGLTKFQPITGDFYKAHFLDSVVEDIDDLMDITFEHFFVHREHLEKNPHLNKLIV